jgi:hypothetical protein
MHHSAPLLQSVARSVRGLVAATACATALGACCATPPNAALLDASFRTPEATLETFRIAARCDEPGLEYRCLSTRFVRGLSLSQLAWREGREEALRSSGLVALFVDGLEPAGPARVEGDQAELVVRSLGRELRLFFVRESVGRAWALGKLVADEDVDWSAAVGSQEIDGVPHAFGRVPVAARPADIDELRLSREWKLDGIAQP